MQKKQTCYHTHRIITQPSYIPLLGGSASSQVDLTSTRAEIYRSSSCIRFMYLHISNHNHNKPRCLIMCKPILQILISSPPLTLVNRSIGHTGLQISWMVPRLRRMFCRELVNADAPLAIICPLVQTAKTLAQLYIWPVQVRLHHCWCESIHFSVISLSQLLLLF